MKNFSDFIEFCERLKRYQLIAFLYERLHGKGYLAEEDFICPLDEELWKEVVVKQAGKLLLKKSILQAIRRYRLDKKLCAKISTSEGLRYLIAVGFHDVPVCAVVQKQSNCVLRLQTGKEEKKEIIFQSGRIEGDLITYAEQEKYFLDRWQFYFTESGKLIFDLQLNNRGNTLDIKRLNIIATDILFE